jgi:ssDNA-binding Zn-finger/Zn-ribbon topoisomerase 1
VCRQREIVKNLLDGNSKNFLPLRNCTTVYTQTQLPMNFLLIATIIICVVIWLRIASKNKSKFGVNLKRIYCPVCNTKQPIIRMPGNGNQFLYGGTTCPKCHTNLDKYGNVIL